MPAPPVLSISASKEEREPMRFTKEWGKGKVFERYKKYREISPGSVIIDRLQIRIDNGVPAHRFILAYMKDGTTFRFDRRPETSKVGTLVGETLGPAKPRKAGDDWCQVMRERKPDTGLSELEETVASTHREIEIKLPDGTDLLYVLSACFAIAHDDKTRNYNLLTFNCYFFSWTIIMIVARHAIPFVAPSPEKVINLVGKTSAMMELSSSLTDKIADALLTLVLDTITTFRVKTGRSLNKGLSKRELMVWGLPTNAVRFLLKGCIKMRLNFGLEDQLKKMVHEQLQKRMEPLLREVLVNQQSTSDRMGEKLWTDHLRDAFGPPVRKQLLKIVWVGLLEALSQGYGDIDTKEIFNQLATNPKIKLLYRLKYRFLGANVIQFTRVWNESLHAAIPAASKIMNRKDSGVAGLEPPNPTFDTEILEDEKQMHKQMFDNAFNAAAQAALMAAKRVVAETADDVKTPGRGAMWETVWGVWDEVWSLARDKAENMVVELITNTMSEIVDLVAKNVVAAISSDDAQPVQATVHPKKPGKQEDKIVNLSAFQTKITKEVRSASISKNRKQVEAHITTIQDAMAAAWKVSKETYKPWEEIDPSPPSQST